ncbi:hypothetical protein FRX31_025447 [Thalictrum thalictroides]|uniref:Uncharacterized protein n=1 Tax=Thalictrum thalictroides TaxID=46969 RepID=A0A7J6VLB8_THATH|nr:hypothetical protein FRX31_025447 [Thalictrum thalictroides]
MDEVSFMDSSGGQALVDFFYLKICLGRFDPCSLPHVFKFESHPVLYGSKPQTKTLSWMELPDNMTYCLCYGSVAGQSAGIPGCP